MNVSLSPQLEKVVQGLVASGDYQSASEVMREGVRLVQERRDALMDLRLKLEKARRDIRSGNWYTTDEVMGEWRRLDEAAAERKPKRQRSA